MPNVVIIGGGIAGLTTAYRLQQNATADGNPPRVRLIESSSRFGGKIVTTREDGFTIEGGPDSVIAQKPWALELIRELGLGDRLLPSNDEPRGASVFHRGRLVNLPEGLQLLAPSRWGEFLRSPLVSWPAKLRFALEPLVKKRRSTGDESVADFVRRRFGEGALWPLAEPVLGHIHVGDVERMSLLATYPRLAELEARHGSLLRGVARLRSKQRSAAATDGTSLFWTLRGGLAELVDALVATLDPASILAGRQATVVERADEPNGRFTVHLDDGHQLPADAVVLATPTEPAADLLADLDPSLADRLRAIRYVSMATLSLGYRRSDLTRPPEGFGFFVPRQAKRRVLAGSWTSTKFDHRAPQDQVLLRIFLGGAAHEDLLDQSDDAILQAVREDLAAILGLNAEPTLTKLRRWPRGYPQYDVGHLERVREIEDALPPEIVLAGSAFHGVGLPDCVRSGSRAAKRCLETLRLG